MAKNLKMEGLKSLKAGRFRRDPHSISSDLSQKCFVQS